MPRQQLLESVKNAASNALRADRWDAHAVAGDQQHRVAAVVLRGAVEGGFVLVEVVEEVSLMDHAGEACICDKHIADTQMIRHDR